MWHIQWELTAWRWVLVCVVTTVGAVANCCDDVDAVEVDAVVDDCVVTRMAYNSIRKSDFSKKKIFLGWKEYMGILEWAKIAFGSFFSNFCFKLVF